MTPTPTSALGTPTAAAVTRPVAAPGQLIDTAEDPLMTAGEVALLLRVTTAWVYAQTRAGRIPHVTLGRYRRYRRSTVLGWLGEMETRRCRR